MSRKILSKQVTKSVSIALIFLPILLIVGAILFVGIQNRIDSQKANKKLQDKFNQLQIPVNFMLAETDASGNDVVKTLDIRYKISSGTFDQVFKQTLAICGIQNANSEDVSTYSPELRSVGPFSLPSGDVACYAKLVTTDEPSTTHGAPGEYSDDLKNKPVKYVDIELGVTY